MNRIGFEGCLVFLVSLPLLGGCGGHDAPAVKWETVKRSDLVDHLNLNGILEAKDQVVVKSEIAGRIQGIRVKEGDRVDKGQPLIAIDPDQLRNRRKRNELKVARSRILLERARRNYRNAQELIDIGGTSKSKLEDLEWEMSLADTQWKEDRLGLDETNLLLDKSLVIAPISGTLISLTAKEGEVIMDGTAALGGGTPLGLIADLSRMTVTIKVSEMDWPKIRAGQSARISTEAQAGISYPGHVEYVAQMARAEEGKNVRHFEVRVALDSLDPGAAGDRPGLAPGINVSVHFKILDLHDVLMLPSELVYRGAGSSGPFAYVWIPGKSGPEKRTIGIGETDFRNVQVLSGIREGDSVQPEPGASESDSGSRNGN